MNAHFSDAHTEAATPTELPRGPLTLVFTDIEGSTRLLRALGPHYPAQLAAHRRILRACFAAHCGVEVDAQGDAFFAVFSRQEMLYGKSVLRARTSKRIDLTWPSQNKTTVEPGWRSTK